MCVPSTRNQLLVCTRHPVPVLSTPSITVPPIAERPHELGRIIEEYAADARATLAATASFTPCDADWVLHHSASSFDEIEKGTRRLVALRQRGTLVGAAELLGISHVALSRWIGRRRVPTGNR